MATTCPPGTEHDQCFCIFGNDAEDVCYCEIPWTSDCKRNTFADDGVLPVFILVQVVALLVALSQCVGLSMIFITKKRKKKLSWNVSTVGLSFLWPVSIFTVFELCNPYNAFSAGHKFQIALNVVAYLSRCGFLLVGFSLALFWFEIRKRYLGAKTDLGANRAAKPVSIRPCSIAVLSVFTLMMFVPAILFIAGAISADIMSGLVILVAVITIGFSIVLIVSGCSILRFLSKAGINAPIRDRIKKTVLVVGILLPISFPMDLIHASLITSSRYFDHPAAWIIHFMVLVYGLRLAIIHIAVSSLESDGLYSGFRARKDGMQQDSATASTKAATLDASVSEMASVSAQD